MHATNDGGRPSYIPHLHSHTPHTQTKPITNNHPQIPQEVQRRVSPDCLAFLHALLSPADRRLGTTVSVTYARMLSHNC